MFVNKYDYKLVLSQGLALGLHSRYVHNASLQYSNHDKPVNYFMKKVELLSFCCKPVWMRFSLQGLVVGLYVV